MISAALNTIKTTLLTNNKYFSNGYVGARKISDGKVTILDGNEFKYVGLGDIEGNFFYIRFLDDIEPESAEPKVVACVNWKMLIPLRFVCWVKNGDLEKIMRCVLNDIYSQKLNVTGYGTLKIDRPSQILFNQEKIFEEETGKITQPEKVTLFAFDFAIHYNFILKKEDCIDRDVCNPC